MPRKKSDPNAADLMVNVFDGTRKPVAASFKVPGVPEFAPPYTIV